MDGWKTNLSFWGLAYFQGRLLLNVRGVLLGFLFDTGWRSQVMKNNINITNIRQHIEILSHVPHASNTLQIYWANAGC